MTHDDGSHNRPRRSFIKMCIGAVAAGAHTGVYAVPAGSTPRPYNRVLLTDEAKKPVRARDLVAGESYIFHYPFVATPCFLLNLGEPAPGAISLQTEKGGAYQAPAGVGPDRSIVAFSAICAHKMTHPAKSVSFINYRHERVKFANSKKNEQEQEKVIYCCSERSVYDVRRGAQVLGGPAKQPLAAILLEYDAARDALYATGTLGGEMFNQFFEKFTNRLQLEYLVTDIQRPIEGTTPVTPIREYCRTTITC